MKKSFLFVILSALTLTGCSVEIVINNDLSDKTEHKHTDVNKDHFCDECKVKYSECADIDGDNICDFCGAKLTNTGDLITDVIPMCGSIFADNFALHQDLLSSDQSDFIQTYINSFIEEENYVNDVNYWCLNTNDYNDIRYLTLGTGYFLKTGKYSSGGLEITTSKEIEKVEINARAYINAYPGYGAQAGTMVYQPDYIASVLLDGEELSLAVKEDAVETISKSITKDYSSSGGTKYFKIESKDARVFLENIKITWKGQNS